MDRRNDQCDHKLEYTSIADSVTRELNYQLDRDDSGEGPNQCNVCLGVSGHVHYCSICEFSVHDKCINYPDTIKYPGHSRHPLKLVATSTVDYIDGRCHFCKYTVGSRMYHCSICNFSIDLRCWINPPSPAIYEEKNHNHAFFLMAKMTSFTCNACGMDGDRNPYVCVECDLMLHKACVNLPRVIEINRHEHRVSRNDHLDHGDWICGVCRKKVDWAYGAFSCKQCSN